MGGSSSVKTPTVKALEEQMCKFARNKGREVTTVFVDLLDYIVGFFNPLQTHIEGWKDKYTQSDSECFFAMMRTYFELMEHELKRNAWYDAWGDLFMSIHVKGNNNAQFFTPPGLCDLMAETSLESYHGEEPTKMTTFGKRIIVSDPSCGSGRNLLAAKAIFDRRGWKNPYMACEDIDLSCCKMTAINLAVHGCFGEVICHDAICEPDKVRYGYIVNETLYPFPTNIPCIRPCRDANRFYAVRLWAERRVSSCQGDELPKRSKQLDLFV